ncbi:N-acetylmuramoyl-L-alanine amidase AmiD [Usitatibacter palustris]|uniref:N-acetylmuramoyl-L-alanine amidase n=2 Tax=Usitatibacter palustris TaxID=2732487 RepID=A0A6M4H6R1_9PROT|nr:N-acetylmuramoyl-L-alanine amidase AmiD [Usitatibacter palustris]
MMLCAALALSGCATGLRFDDSYQSTGHDSRAQFLVLHFTSSDFPSSLKILTSGPVSSHYLVRDDPPTIYRLVDENRRAWHAGVSNWRGSTLMNASSIGIEIVNRGEMGGPGSGVWEEYSQAQMDVVMALVKDIVARHKILPERIVGHSDIAPTRKVDPGPRFPWKRLADEGLIPWPDEKEVARRIPAFEQVLPDITWFQDRLVKFGYGIPLSGSLDELTVRTLSAFQMRHRPKRYDGMPDAETAAMLDVLTGP